MELHQVEDFEMNIMQKMNTVAKRMTLWLLTGFKFLWIGLLIVLSLPVALPIYMICEMPDGIESLIYRLKKSLNNDDTRNGGH